MILVQRLDPNHDSLIVDLLANRTGYTVEQALEGAEILGDHLYIIPPGRYLTIKDGHLHLEPPPDHHGARLPFDMLLESFARQRGRRSIGIVLSGTGADGCVGLQALGYGAMPANAIASGAIDDIAPAAGIPAIAIAQLGKSSRRSGRRTPLTSPDTDIMAEILETIKQASGQDFGAYKPDTAVRRVERRMALAGVLPGSMARYLKLMRSDAAEQEALTSDLLIHVTSFFRDPKVFDYLAANVLPELIAEHRESKKLRVWTAGCSTGEECYSLGMVQREAIKASGRDIRHSDFCVGRRYRRGHDRRLERFFVKEGQHHRVRPELRSTATFSVQNVLSDPPFSRLDLISCRNLLIYLSPGCRPRSFPSSISHCVQAACCSSARPKPQGVAMANSNSFPSPKSCMGKLGQMGREILA